MATQLDALIDTWLGEELDESPIRATSLGIDGYDDKVGDYSAAGFARREARDDKWLASFSAIGDEGLSLDEQIDRDLVVSTLRGRLVMRDWQNWRRDPATYLGPCLQGVFALFLYRLHDEPQLAAYAAARLREVPRVLAEARANLSPELASKLIVERGLGQCQAGVQYAGAVVPGEVGDTGARALLATAGAEAAAAFESFAEFLRSLAEDAHGEYAIGEERYSRLLQEKELLGYGASEMRERGRAAYAELDDDMQRVAATVPGGSSDWRATVESLNADHPSSPDELRAAYEECTARARQFLIDNALVTLPDGEHCMVEPSPPFQRPVLAVASYNAPPAFKPSLTGHFFVPYPPEGASPEDVQKRLATNSYSSIPTITAHEAYPGHHWHLTWVQGNPRKIRKVLSTSYFTEGWGLFAERVMREHGFFADPRHDLCHLDARIFRAARIVVDTSLHIGDMSFDQAVEFMRTQASLSEPTARAEVGRYCAWPTQASSYLTGCLEIERIREAFGGTARAFNDKIAATGMLPIALARRATLTP
jgi:uncharacterized protein (DUF885 family)